MPQDVRLPGSAGSVDHYRLVRRLAQGGMAEVFLATDTRSGRTVALKKILPHVSNDPDFRERFFHEIKIQVKLNHPNVVSLLDFSPLETKAYIVMEFVDGGSLQGLLEAVGRLPWDVALHAIEQALRGLAAAHHEGIIHRDVKPQNVMWTRDGTVKIADFGISQAPHMTRLTLTGTVVGTPSHMSPEQARGEPLDPRTDLFSAGTILYELLTGVNPFSAPDVTATLRRVVDISPDAPSLVDPTLPASLDALQQKLHAKERDKRFANAHEAADAIRRLLAEEGILNPAPLFRSFVADPAGFVRERKQQFAREKAREAEQLLADDAAPPEQALWAAYQTLTTLPEDSGAKSLFAKASERAGQRERPVDNPKIRELEKQLREKPDDLQTLLQLAKLYRLERDFLNVMRFFRKLQAISPGDAYTQGQIKALLGGGTALSTRAAAGVGVGPSGGADTRSSAPPSSASGRRPPVAPPADAGEDEGIPTWQKAGIAVGFVALLTFGIWWSRRPGLDLAQTTPEERQRAEAVVKLLKGAAAPEGAARPTAVPDSEEDLAVKAIDRAERLEKEGSAGAAQAYLRDALAKMRERESRILLLFAIAETQLRAGDRDGSFRTLDEVVAMGGEEAAAASFRKGEVLESAGEVDEARRLYERLSITGTSAGQCRARLKLAMLADRAGDPVRALALYEEVVARDAASPEANPARLGAAAIYRATGRPEDARRMYEEVLARSAPDSDFRRSAESGLKTLGD